jgi:hypothetical protein
MHGPRPTELDGALGFAIGGMGAEKFELKLRDAHAPSIIPFSKTLGQPPKNSARNPGGATLFLQPLRGDGSWPCDGQHALYGYTLAQRPGGVLGSSFQRWTYRKIALAAEYHPRAGTVAHR